jgi:ATPase subunit of ABC transporter with duplicated ATPase domains
LIGYNDNPLLDEINVSIFKENYILISGKNGVGKSTFIKTILDIIKPLGGSYKWNASAKITYFEQENSYPIDKTPYELASETYVDYMIAEVRGMLGSFGIDFEHQNRPLKQLSGGEITKLRLCLLSKSESNVFVLDEPTNHLDPNTKRALKEALVNYKGTVILVSHDKDFYEDLISSELKFQ